MYDGYVRAGRVVNKMRNAQNTERSKGTEQVKIMEQGTEQMEITMNPHGTIVYTERTNYVVCMLAIYNTEIPDLKCTSNLVIEYACSTGSTSETLEKYIRRGIEQSFKYITTCNFNLIYIIFQNQLT